MSILRSGEAESIEERDAYLRYAHAKRRSENGGEGRAGESGNSETGPNGRALMQLRLDEMDAARALVLPAADHVHGTSTSPYHLRLNGCAGQGIHPYYTPPARQT